MKGTVAAIDVIPLSPALGAEIRGVDLRETLDDDTVALICQAWWEHLAIVFRDQDLSEEQQVSFATRLGPLGRRASPTARRGVDNASDHIMLVSNIRKDGKPIGSVSDGEMMFHSDMAYVATPHLGTMLYGLEVTRSGGETRLSNQYKAYDALSPATRARLAGRNAVQIYNYGGVKIDIAGDLTGIKQHAHPAVCRHPESGRAALYVSRLMTGWIEGLPRAESDAVLEECFAVSERPEHIYDHRWRAGDLLIWDNRCCNHARNDFPPDQRRLLRRCTILGSAPIAA